MMQEQEIIQVWVVMEGDRGLGPSCRGVYASEADAQVNIRGSYEWVEGPFELPFQSNKITH